MIILQGSPQIIGLEVKTVGDSKDVQWFLFIKDGDELQKY